MTGLDALLRRGGLGPTTRLLVLLTIRTAEADWDGLAAVCGRARAAGCQRSEIEEVLLQGVLFFGFPRSVSAFETLERAWPAEAAPAGGSLPREEWHDAGTRLFDAIYDRNAKAVHAMLRGFHTAFHDFVIESAYGRVLSRPGLDPQRRELVAVGALAALDQLPQLIAHGRGALRFGANAEEVRETLVTALGTAPEDAPAIEELMRRIAGPTNGPRAL